MTADVWIEIENYEVMGAAEQDEILFIVSRVLSGSAENAGIRLRHISTARRDVCMSPGTPESFHKRP